MDIGFILLVGIVVAIMIYIGLGIKSHQHKGIAILLILFLLLAVFAFNATFAGKDVQIKTVGDAVDAVKLYFSWFGLFFENIKTVTTQAVKVDWKNNETT
jgi:hypothetical protein